MTTFNVKTWTLPIGQAVITPIAPPLQERYVYFACYLGGAVGMLDIQTSQYFLWEVPLDYWQPATSAGSIYDLARQGNRGWIPVGNRLVSFTPLLGQSLGQCDFEAYFELDYLLTNSPFPAVTRVALDGAGKVWYTGATHLLGSNNGISLGYLDVTQSQATYWDLPSPYWSVAQFWPESGGNGVWFTSTTANIGLSQPGPYLGRFDATTNKAALWWPSQPTLTVGGYIIGDVASGQTQPNIWFVQNNQLFHFLPGFAVYGYLPVPLTAVSPGMLALDSQKSLWMGNYADLSVWHPSAGTASPFTERLTEGKPVTHSGRTLRHNKIATVGTATTAESQITFVPAGPAFVNAAMPLPVTPPGPAANPIGNVKAGTGREIWFSQAAAQTIGVVTPT